MPTKIYWLHKFDNSAKIGIMARPRGDNWLEDEIKHLKNSSVNVLVSLLERSEIYELDLDHEEELCLSKNIEYLNLPIPDRDIPGQGDKVDQLIDKLIQKLNAGLSIVIHCRMGIGRSSIIAAAVLMTYGFKSHDIIKNISIVRGLKVPDTDKQIAWLKARET